MLRMTKRKWIASLVLIICGVIIFISTRLWTGHADIAAGNISYTYNCAWVDWKHARPKGIKTFVDDFNNRFTQTALNETFKITYGQQGSFKTMGYSIFTYSILKEYEVLKFKEDETIKNKLMFQIFKDVSYLFEKQQREVFWGVLQSSAFKEGDLMGNLIGFYIACGEITQEEASKICEELPLSISLQLKKENKFQTNTSFIPKYRIVTNSNKPIFPKQLTQYDKLKEFENYIRPLEEIKLTNIFSVISSKTTDKLQTKRRQ